ncbi:putative DNA repair metallo-beta-lactamase, ribonuclease Z/Hydroxyacylglutathione hydrolase [Plasmopara halstedii]
MRCLVCSVDMASWTIPKREIHVNSCLDVISMKSFECPMCGKELPHNDERRRIEHVNRCLDTVEALDEGYQSSGQKQEASSATHVGDKEAMMDKEIETQATEIAQVDEVDINSESELGNVCKICGLDTSGIDLMCHIRHVKRCGSKFGVRPEDMGEVEQTETLAARLEEKEVVNAYNVMLGPPADKKMAQVAQLERSNVFDELMRGSKTAAVLNARKRLNPFKFKRKTSQRRRLLYPDFKCIKGTNPPFIVDGFNYACPENSSIYFLTHFHSDHYTGITKDFDCGIIYCTEVTAKLIVQDVQVTFMDANHCPGAAIILFCLKEGKTYLHTGDFRFHKKMLDYSPLQPFIPTGKEIIDNNGKVVGLRRLDGVYLDTTYCNPKYTFPTQHVAINHAFEIMDKHFKQEKVLFLFGSYTIGKERLFMEIARKYQKKVCVSKAKLKVIKTFGWPAESMQLLTTETAVTNLHVVRMQDLHMDNLTVLLAKHHMRFHRIVAFRPTGWTFSSKNPRSMSSCCLNPSGKICVYGIPYSEHSSFSELSDFVKVINPISIFPTVNCSSKRKATNQVNTLRQIAFHNISVLFKEQRQIKKQLNGQKQWDNQHQFTEKLDAHTDGKCSHQIKCLDFRE